MINNFKERRNTLIQGMRNVKKKKTISRTQNFYVMDVLFSLFFCCFACPRNMYRYGYLCGSARSAGVFRMGCL